MKGSTRWAALFVCFAACSPLPVDDRLQELIRTTAARAPIGMRFATIRGEYRMRLQHTLRRTPFHLVVSTAADSLLAGNPRVRAVACNILYTYVKNERALLQQHAAAIPMEAVDALIRGTGRIRDHLAFYAVRACVYTATLKKRYNKLFAMLESHPQQAVRAEGYARLMTYGRLEVLPRLRQYAASAEEYPALSALRAPLWMYDYTKAEKQAVAAWMLPHFRGTDSERALIAARVLFNKIGDPYRRLVLDDLDRQTADLEQRRRPPSRSLMAFLRGLRIHQLPQPVQARYRLIRTRLERLL